VIQWLTQQEELVDGVRSMSKRLVYAVAVLSIAAAVQKGVSDAQPPALYTGPTAVTMLGRTPHTDGEPYLLIRTDAPVVRVGRRVYAAAGPPLPDGRQALRRVTGLPASMVAAVPEA
jgi:hypothetical protein